MRWKLIKERVVGPAEIKLEYIEKVGQFLLSKDCPSFSWNGLTICYGNRVLIMNEEELEEGKKLKEK